MKESGLCSWLYKNNCFLKSDSGIKHTHLCLDGGKLNIPDELMSEFFKEYSKGVRNKETYYICECNTPVTKMYCDFDFVCDEKIDITFITEVCKIISEVIKFHFKDSYNLLVCTSPCKSVVKNDVQKIKTGVHLVVPDLFVSIENALGLSKLFVTTLKNKYPNYDWGTIIDDHVYDNGLRMICSGKIGKNKTVSNEYYYPRIVIKTVDTLQMFDISSDFNKLEEFLGYCCIRSTRNERPTDPIESIPVIRKKRVDTTVVKSVEERVESFIRQQTIPQWNSSLIQFKKQNSFYTAKIDSMYCMNTEREHNSCGIYFLITEMGLIQRCFCKCNTTEGRKNGLCSEFKSDLFPLPKDLKIMLFGRETKTKKKQVLSGKMQVETFSSNSMMQKEETTQMYLKMSMNTIRFIESKCV